MENSEWERVERVKVDMSEAKLCPLCNSPVEMWKRGAGVSLNLDEVVYSVCCVHGDDDATFGTTDHICPFYMPDNQYFKATQREAMMFWNEMAEYWAMERNICPLCGEQKSAGCPACSDSEE